MLRMRSWTAIAPLTLESPLQCQVRASDGVSVRTRDRDAEVALACVRRNHVGERDDRHSRLAVEREREHDLAKLNAVVVVAAVDLPARVLTARLDRRIHSAPDLVLPRQAAGARGIFHRADHELCALDIT